MRRSRQQAELGRTIPTGWPDADLQASDSRASRAAQAPPEMPGPLMLVGAVVAIAALVLLVPPLLIGARSPRDVGEDFLQALVDGDTTAVRGHLDAADGALDIALTDEVVRAAEDRVERFSIDAIDIDGDHARIIATLSTPAGSLETSLDLQRRSGGPLWRSSWQLLPVTLPVLSLEVPVGSDELRVNDQVVSIPGGSRPRGPFGTGSIALRVLPGTYELQAQERSDALAPRRVRATLPPVLGRWVSPPVDVTFDLTEAGMEEIHRQLGAVLEECERSVSPQPEDCPLAAPPDVTSEGTWTVVSPPILTDRLAYDGVFEFSVTGLTAQFTVPASPPAQTTTVYVVQPSGVVHVSVDRDGRIATQWVAANPPTWPEIS